MEISFSVQGSEPEPYEVAFLKKSPEGLMAFCTCTAGLNGLHCKHRLMILNGDTTGIVSNNIEKVKTVQEWLRGTTLEQVIFEYRELDEKATEIKASLAKIKKKMARMMRGE